MKAQISCPVLVLPAFFLIFFLAGCAPSWSTASVEPTAGASATASVVEWSEDPSAIVVTEDDITDVPYETLANIKVTVSKTTAFDPDPTREMVTQKLRDEAAKLGANAVVLVNYSDVHISFTSWGSRDGHGRAVKLPPGYAPGSALPIPLEDFAADDARLTCGQINVELTELASQKQGVEDALQGERTGRKTSFYAFGILASGTLTEGDDAELVKLRESLNAREATLISLKQTKGCNDAIARSETSTAASSSAVAKGVTSEVLASSEHWLNSGIEVVGGESYEISASGSWTANERSCGWSGPDGGSGPCSTPQSYPQAVSGSYLALIGKIGEGPPFLIGNGIKLIADRSAVLYLRMNDAPGGFGNNEGTVTVRITGDSSP